MSADPLDDLTRGVMAQYGVPFYSSPEDIEPNYKLWLTSLLPRHFRGVNQFGPHHEQFWQWGWSVELGQIAAPPAYLAIWPRGGNKSTTAEGFAVACGARGTRKFGLYVCRTQPQADKHIASINSMILRSNVGKVYPGMAEARVIEVGDRKKEDSWNRQSLTTGTGFTMQGYGLQSAFRGVRMEEYRPDLIIISDVDEITDKPTFVQSLLATLAGSVFGAASNDCVVLFEQNLIHHNSMINQILTREVDVLSDRIEGGPIPALYDAKYERRGEKWFVVSPSRPSWVGQDIAACENKLNTEGKIYFDRECQHDVDQIIGRPRFNLDALKEFTPVRPTTGEVRLTTDTYDAESIAFYPAPTGAVSLWFRPERRHRYAAGADTAEGKDVAEGVSSKTDPDYCVAHIFDADSGEQVARVRGRMTETAFGEILYAMLRWYNNAFLVPEVKGGYGRTTLNKLLELGYPEDLIWNKHMLSELAGQPKHEGKIFYHDLGWDTGPTNRPLLVSFADDAINDHTIELYDATTIEECRHFCHNSNGKPEAEAGYHDDCVLALCFLCAAIWLIRHRRPRRVGPPVIRYAGTGEPVEGQREDRDRVKDWQGRM